MINPNITNEELEELLHGYHNIDISFIRNPKHKKRKIENDYKISVIIPTYNRRNLLEKTLMSLDSQTLSSNCFEVIVVDDDSDDGTRAMIKEIPIGYQLKYIFWPRKKRFIPGSPMNRVGPVRNLGARYADSDKLLFLDCDNIASHRLLEEHLNALVEENDIIIGLSLDENTETDPREGYFDVCLDDPMRLAIPWIALYECNFSIGKNLFLEVGGFDKGFVYWGFEGDELGFRLLKSGGVMKLNRAAVSIHQYHEKEYIDQKSKDEGIRRNARYFHMLHDSREIGVRYSYQIGELSDEKSAIGRKSREKPKYLSLTKKCNNNCSYCSIFSSESEIATLDMISKNTGKKIITGGEPTLFEKRKELFEAVNMHGVHENVEFLTNARVFYSDKNARIYTKYFKNFLVKIFSSDEKIHDKMTDVPGSCNQTLGGIKNLMKYGAGVAIQYLVTEDNHDDISSTMKFLISIGVETFDVVISQPFEKEIFEYLYSILSQISRYEESVRLKVKFDFFGCIKNPVISSKAIIEKRFIDDDFHINKLSSCHNCQYTKRCRGRFLPWK